MAFEARMSMSRKSLSAPMGVAPQTKQPTFPLLKIQDILQCLQDMQMRVTEEELTKPERLKDSIRRVYEQLVEFCIGKETRKE